MLQFSLSSQFLCHFCRHLCYSRRAEDTMQYWWTILHPLFFWVWRDPDLGLGSLGSPIKFSVSRLTRLTCCHVYLLHRALSVAALLSAQRGNGENRVLIFHIWGPACLSSHQRYRFPSASSQGAFSNVHLSVSFLYVESVLNRFFLNYGFLFPHLLLIRPLP